MAEEQKSCADLVSESGKAPNKDCLQAAARDILNDLDVFDLAWQSHRTKVGWTLWFIMARSLMGFFFCYERRQNKKTKKYADDVLAADYLDAGAWKAVAERIKKERPDDYRAAKEAANKLSAHLTYSRADLRKSGGTPPSAAVHEYLMATAAIWLDELEPERRAWFGRGIPSGPRAT